MMNKITLIVLAVVLVAAGWFGRDLLNFSLPTASPEEQATVPTKGELPEGEVCIQVITPARNPDTGEIKEYPTPCDVPEGWEVIQNDIPAL